MLKTSERKVSWARANPEKVAIIKRRYVKNNPKKVAQERREHAQKIRKWVEEVKAKRGCEDCGLKELYCLEWHHLDPKTKEKHTVACSTWASTRREMDKCVVVCANCHRRRHHKMKGENTSD